MFQLLKILKTYSLLCLYTVYSCYVGNFVQILVFRPAVDPNVRKGSGGPRKVKKFQEMHETHTYRPMGLIRQRNKGSGAADPQRRAIFLFFNKNKQFPASLCFELQL